MDQSIANRDVQVLPMKGMLFEMYYCIIREPSQTGNGISVYEGIRIINRQLNTISELTVDELSLFISILDSINITDILMTATQIGLNLINQ